MVWGIFKSDSISETYKKMKAQDLKEYESKDGVYKHQAKAGRYGGSEKESDYVKGPSDAELKKIEAEKKKKVKESSDEELDTLINEVLSKDAPAGKWIGDFVHSDNPKFAGKSKEKRKQMALAAYYAAQKKESTDYESFIELDEEVQGEIVKTGAKEIKHANIKDKQDDQDVMEPHSKGEADFLDKHSIEVTDDPAADGAKTGSDKLKHASEPKGNGAGKYDGKGKTGVKESAGEDDSSKEASAEATAVAEEASCSSKGKKKSYSAFKQKVMQK